MRMQGMPTGYWAKFKDSTPSVPAKWLPLAFHLIDVAVMFRALLDDGQAKALARLAGATELSEVQLQRLSFLAFLHDIGKAAVRFQKQIFPNAAPRSGGHTLVACSLFSGTTLPHFLNFLPPDFSTWFTAGKEDGEQLFTRMMIATFAHHGDRIDISVADGLSAGIDLEEVQWDRWSYADYRTLFAHLAEIVRTLWPDIASEGHALNIDAAFMNQFNGLLTQADWMASDDRHFHFDEGDNWRDRAEFARTTAERLLVKSGRKASQINTTFEGVFGFQPNAMQAALIAANGELYH